MTEVRKAHGVLGSIAVDRTSLPQTSLDVADRIRTNCFPWTGQFSPQLVERLLQTFAPRSAVVLDPFVGSGTSLVESARVGLPAYGAELNPAAVILSQVYQIVNVDAALRTRALRDVRDALFDAIGSPYGPLLSNQDTSSESRASLEKSLVHVWRNSSSRITRRLAAALVVLCDFHRKSLDGQTVHRTWFRLESIVRALPESDQSIVVLHADARSLPIEPGTIDMVITSPPYINVHNYHQQFRRSVEALGWDVLSIARSEIGSNRQNRSNRFLTVIQYSLDMTLVLRELARVAKTDARFILVVGRESLVRGGRFFNGELVAEIGVRCAGLTIERRQERMFQNRYGLNIYEDILHFRSTGDVVDEEFALASARHIAAKVLCEARNLIPTKERPGLDDAISRINTVLPSPMPPRTALSHR